MVNSIINIYKRRRKYNHLSFQCKKQYAFIGLGNHSLNNLYPVLDYLHVPLKYIVSNTSTTARLINESTWYPAATDNLDEVLSDPDIEGIFISAAPENHFELLNKVLSGRKNIFVEKPPCQSLDQLKELILLQKKINKVVVTGMQKRYAPANLILKKKIKYPLHYSFKYVVGNYPEGNALMELFIHPVDMIVYLFGEMVLKSVIQSEGTLMLHVLHEKTGIAGSIELSTAYSWSYATEEMQVIERDGIFVLNNLSQLLFKNKPKMIHNIPLEKLMKFIPETRILFNQNSFLPLFQHNDLYINGFYSELKTFIDICEGADPEKNLSDLSSLLPTYHFLNEINNRLKNKI